MPAEPKTYFCDYCGFAEMCQSYYYDEPVALFMKSLTRCIKYRKGEVIATEGEHAEYIYAITRGVVKVYGGEEIRELSFPGEVVGVDGIKNNQYTSTLVAAMDVQLCRFSVKDFYGISQVTLDFTNMITRLMSNVVIAKQEVISILLIEDSTRRVLSYLRMMLQKFKRSGVGYNSFLLPVTRKEFAKTLGLSPSTLNRALAILIKNRVISIDKRIVTMHDRESASD